MFNPASAVHGNDEFSFVSVSVFWISPSPACVCVESASRRNLLPLQSSAFQVSAGEQGEHRGQKELFAIFVEPPEPPTGPLQQPAGQLLVLRE
jgi:hypothetical protein